MTTVDFLRKIPLRRFSDYNPPDADTRVRSSLSRLLLEGSAADIAIRIKDSFITPFALALKASSFQIGLLTAVPFLIGALAQLLTSRLMYAAGSRKRFVLAVLLLSGVVWVPVALLPWIFDSAQVWWLLGLVTLGITTFQLPSPAWGSWIAQLLPVNRRGRFIGARATQATLVGVLTVLGLGRLMDLMQNRVFVGFSMLFFGVALCRFLSFYLYSHVYDPPLPPRATTRGTGMRESLRGLFRTDLGRFMGINAFFNFSCTLAGPFFTVLMIRDLGFSFTTFILLQMVSAFSAMIGLQVWGRVADRLGNARILHITVPLIGLVAMSWTINQTPAFLVLVHVMGGLVWSGYNVSSLNYALETSSDQERTRLVGMFNAFAGVGIFLGSLTGGLIAPHVPQIFAYSILTLILISGILRFGTGILLLIFVREVREGAPSQTFRLRVPHPAFAVHHNTKRKP